MDFNSVDNIQQNRNIQKTDAPTNNEVRAEFLFEDNAVQNNKNNSKLFKKDEIDTSSVMADLYEKLNPITQNYDILKKANANNVAGLAGSIVIKSNNIVTNISTKITNYMLKINQLSANGNMTEKEIEDEIKAIQNKIDALKSEASVKLDILTVLSDTLFEVHGMLMQMKNNGIGSSELLDFMSGLINGVSENPSNFPDIHNEKDFEEQMSKAADKIFGNNTTEKFEKQKAELEKQIDDLNNELKDETKTEQEQEKIKTMINVCTFKYTLLDTIMNIIASIMPDKKDN